MKGEYVHPSFKNSSNHFNFMFEPKYSLQEAKVKLDETTMLQILQYQQALTAKFLIVTNGHETLGAKIESGKLHALQNFPDYL